MCGEEARRKNYFSNKEKTQSLDRISKRHQKGLDKHYPVYSSIQTSAMKQPVQYRKKKNRNYRMDIEKWTMESE